MENSEDHNMRRYRVSEIPNLQDITFTQTKRLARELCPEKTDGQIGEIVGMPKQTIQRLFSDPEYHPTMPNIPGLCRAIGNNLIIEWPVAQIGGYVVFPPSAKTKTAMQHYVAGITREFSDLLETEARAKMKGSPGGEKYTAEERLAILRDLNQLEEKIESAKLMLKGKK